MEKFEVQSKRQWYLFRFVHALIPVAVVGIIMLVVGLPAFTLLLIVKDVLTR